MVIDSARSIRGLGRTRRPRLRAGGRGGNESVAQACASGVQRSPRRLPGIAHLLRLWTSRRPTPLRLTGRQLTRRCRRVPGNRGSLGHGVLATWSRRRRAIRRNRRIRFQKTTWRRCSSPRPTPSARNRQPFRFLVLRDGPKARGGQVRVGRVLLSCGVGKRAVDATTREAATTRPRARD